MFFISTNLLSMHLLCSLLSYCCRHNLTLVGFRRVHSEFPSKGVTQAVRASVKMAPPVTSEQCRYLQSKVIPIVSKGLLAYLKHLKKIAPKKTASWISDYTDNLLTDDMISFLALFLKRLANLWNFFFPCYLRTHIYYLCYRSILPLLPAQYVSVLTY